jgi:nucleotide-binding universal stress UspA family protein
MFVVMALVTTVATTPLTTVLYPAWYQKKLEAWKAGEIDWDGNRLDSEGGRLSEESIEKVQDSKIRHLLVYLNLDSLPSLFTFIALLGGDRPATTTKIHRTKTDQGFDSDEIQPSTPAVALHRPLEVHGLRMVGLSDRVSAVMQVAESGGYAHSDPVINALRTFAQLNNVAASGSVAVVPDSSYAETLTGKAADHGADLLLIPWTEEGVGSDNDSVNDRFGADQQDEFIQRTLEKARCNTAVFVNRGFGAPAVETTRPPFKRAISGLSMRSHQETPVQPIADRSHHVYFPFFGGADDRAALRFVLQLAQNGNITATIIHFTPGESKSPASVSDLLGKWSGRGNGTALSTPTQTDTDVFDASAAQDVAVLNSLRNSLGSLARRVVFTVVPTSTPVADALAHARQEIAQTPRNAGDLVVVGRGGHTAILGTEDEPSAAAAEMRKSLGVVAETMVSGGVRGSVLVFQAGRRGIEG